MASHVQHVPLTLLNKRCLRGRKAFIRAVQRLDVMGRTFSEAKHAQRDVDGYVLQMMQVIGNSLDTAWAIRYSCI